jgi:hypothetical protein
MLLFHSTPIDNFLKILKDGKLRPSIKTSEDGQRPGKYLPYVFFNTIPKTQLETMLELNGVGICFDCEILLNKIFYAASSHTAGNLKKAHKFKLSVKKDINKILYSLYLYSVKANNSTKNDPDRKKLTKSAWKKWIFIAFQEVFSKIEPSLNDAKYIILKKKDSKLIAQIKDKFPNIIIITSKNEKNKKRK